MTGVLAAELFIGVVLADTLLTAVILAGAGALTGVRAVFAATGRRFDLAEAALTGGFFAETLAEILAGAFGATLDSGLATDLDAGFAVDLAADREADLADFTVWADLPGDFAIADLVDFRVEPRAAFAGERTFFTELLFISAL